MIYTHYDYLEVAPGAPRERGRAVKGDDQIGAVEITPDKIDPSLRIDGGGGGRSPKGRAGCPVTPAGKIV